MMAATAIRLATASYSATLISETGRHYPLSFDTTPDALDEARDAALIFCTHKTRLVIREADDHGARLHVYAIKMKGRPSYIGRVGEEQRFQPLQAEHVVTVDLEAL